MKYYAIALTLSIAAAQSTTTTYTTDINGNRVSGPSTVSSDGDHTQLMKSINGRQVPVEQSDERVLSEDPNHKVIERIVKKYGTDGSLSSTERQVIDTQTRPGGSTVQTTTYRTDINGRMSEAERRTVDSSTQGAVTSTNTLIDRPSINGSFQTVEKRAQTSEKLNDHDTHQDETIYRLSQNGDYTPWVREVRDITTSGGETVEKTNHYEPRATNQLQLSAQTVATTTTQPGGGAVTEVSLYGSSWDGRVTDNQAGLQLREQQRISKQPGADGRVTETTSVRRPSVSDPSRLGNFQKISETVCTGKCDQKQ